MPQTMWLHRAKHLLLKWAKFHIKMGTHGPYDERRIIQDVGRTVSDREGLGDG